MPAFPSIDLSRFDVVALAGQLPRPEMPTLPAIDTERLAELARDAAYVSIGLGVLTIQQTQVRRRELQSEIERRRRQLIDQFDSSR